LVCLYPPALLSALIKICFKLFSIFFLQQQHQLPLLGKQILFDLLMLLAVTSKFTCRVAKRKKSNTGNVENCTTISIRSVWPTQCEKMKQKNGGQN